MSTPRMVVLELSQLEATHLAGLVTQFAELLTDTASERTLDDPAILRLVPDAYADDEEAAREFRDLTQRELLDRRATDAATVLASLHSIGSSNDVADAEPADETALLSLDPDDVGAWLRTLAAIRLVLASRLGIVDEDDHDDEDPRFGIYDWLGLRLDGLVRAVEPGL